MTIAIIEKLNTILLLLTPSQRLNALKHFDNSSMMDERWFTIIGIALLIILVMLLLWVSYKRKAEERKIAKSAYNRFVDYAERIGLSEHERRILFQVTEKCGLKQSDAIFSMEDAFNHGAAKLAAESIATNPKTEDNEQLRADLALLREKLGFLPRSFTGLTAKSRKFDSRQIPIGKELHITPYKNNQSAGIDSNVIKNDDIELTLKLKTPVQTSPGERWRARFNYNASVREFDSSVVRCNGEELVLNHSEDVRFINLRRFLRVPVNKQALVARFPFVKDPHNEQNDNTTTEINSWGPPQFVPATVTELAVVGLRLDAPLDVTVGERLIVIFNLDEEENRRSTSKKAGKTTRPKTRNVPYTTPSGSKIIQDIGEVKRTKISENGLSIAVELIGLNDSDVNELVRATNSASAQAVTSKPDSKQDENEQDLAVGPANLDGQQDTEKDAVEHAAVHGA